VSREVRNIHDWVDEQGILRRTISYVDAEADQKFHDYVRSVVDRAPELKDSQVDQLRALLRPVTRPFTEADKAKVVRKVTPGPSLHTETVILGKAVYFIRSMSPVGEIKIGYSNNPQGRLQLLQTGNPYPLEVLATIPGEGRRKERELHERFATSRLSGEWFEPTADLLAYIEEIKAVTP
jgi:hypothetical protein